ncbi:ankyrin repeat-containing domain protein [Mycena maculata]|uniref:Ankyrin repeat-containing domain protein n=1 Tax=Mycena maculata TaxID=230809 RepID=A0AAD7JZ74_9AGAR|nr:ankyrin repeat-containing domain protein [Mycena maculata]
MAQIRLGWQESAFAMICRGEDQNKLWMHQWEELGCTYVAPVVPRQPNSAFCVTNAARTAGHRFILPALSLMAETLGTVTSILQLVDTVQTARELIQDFHHAPEEQRRLLSEMDNLRPLIEELRLVADNPMNGLIQQMQLPVEVFHSTMEHFTEKLKEGKGPLAKLRKRMSWTMWSKKEATEYLDKFEQFKSLVNSWLSLNIRNIIIIVGNKPYIYEFRLRSHPSCTSIGGQSGQHIASQSPHCPPIRGECGRDPTRPEILTKVDGATAIQQEQIDLLGRRELESGFSPIVGFGDGNVALERHFGAVAYYMAAGAGKTVLASLVVDHLETPQNKNISVACIYLNHKETKIQILSNLFSGLWRQLVHGKNVGTQAFELYKRHSERRTRPPLDDVQDILSTTVAEWSKVYIIADAEYPEDDQCILLEHLVSKGPTVNLMMTARPHISPAALLATFHAIEIHANTDDIRQYIDGCLRKSSRLSKLVKAQPELHWEILSKIITSVDGMFLLAKLHISALSTKPTIKAVREALKNLPKDLEETYNDAMNRIDSQNEEDRKITHLVLTWVTNAKRPLSVQELQEALAIEPGATQLDVDNLLDIGIIFSVCAGLVIQNGSGVRLVHYTTQEYLNTIQAQRFPNAQTDITRTLLTLLAFDHPSTLRSYSGLVHYAQYCLLHAARKPERSLRTMLVKFLTQVPSWNNFMAWYWHATPWNFPYWPSHASPLWIAAAANLLEIAEWHPPEATGTLLGYSLLKKGADVNVQGEQYGTALQAAYSQGHWDIFQLLVKNGANVNVQGGEYETALQAASVGDHWDIVRLLIENGADVNAQGGEYGTTLHVTCYKGQWDIAQLLVENGADVDVQSGKHGCALYGACLNGHINTVWLLINSGANVNAQGGEHVSALRVASYKGHMNIVQLLIKNGADVNVWGGEYGSALQAATFKGHWKISRLLVKKGANAMKTWSGSSSKMAHSQRKLQKVLHEALQQALHRGNQYITRFIIENGADININTLGGGYGNMLRLASETGQEAAVHLLIENGVDVNTQCGDYGSAMQVVSSRGHKNIVQLLIKNGSNVNAQGGINRNALQAVCSYSHVDIVQLLIQNGANVNAKGGHYGSALHAASFNGHGVIVHVLIEGGADINAQSGMYGSGLAAACFYGHMHIIQLLIENGADVNAEGREYGNALQATSWRGAEAIVRLLIAHGVDVNAHGEVHGSTLHVASCIGHMSIVQIFMENSANVNAQGGRYICSPLHLALWAGHDNIGRFLIENGADVNAGGVYGKALDLAAQASNKDITWALIENGADVNAQGGSALRAACSIGYGDIVRLLVENGADVNAGSWTDETTLDVACLNGHKSIIQQLIENGADVNVWNGTALRMAYFKEHRGIVQLLIENGADVNAEGGMVSTS